MIIILRSWLSFTCSSIFINILFILNILIILRKNSLFHFTASSCIEDTTCYRSIAERFPQTVTSMDDCTVIFCMGFSLVFSLFFWCWVKPLVALKFLLYHLYLAVGVWTVRYFIDPVDFHQNCCVEIVCSSYSP